MLAISYSEVVSGLHIMLHYSSYWLVKITWFCCPHRKCLPETVLRIFFLLSLISSLRNWLFTHNTPVPQPKHYTLQSYSCESDAVWETFCCGCAFGEQQKPLGKKEKGKNGMRGLKSILHVSLFFPFPLTLFPHIYISQAIMSTNVLLSLASSEPYSIWMLWSGHTSMLSL